MPSLTTYGQEDGEFHGLGNVGTRPWARPDSGQQTDGQIPHSESSTSEDNAFPNLQNPSDALGILARVAEKSSGQQEATDRSTLQADALPPTVLPAIDHLPPPSTAYYPLLFNGALTLPTIHKLLDRYWQHYHPYYPLAPAQTFDKSRLPETLKNEPHLVTAILVISSKDLVGEPHIFTSCSEYMKCLVSDLAAGGDADVEAVEALLLLAEWAPYTQRRSGKVGKGEEDKESWMHVGMALRIAYFLALDRYSFRLPEEQKDPSHARKRLIWTAAYIMDRHVSIRIGKAFWSRGPGPLTTLRREDYPSLLPKSPNDEDYASIFQANLELTQLFSSVHDVLYSNLGSGFRSHLTGSYIKFIDDFRSAIYGWKSIWGTLTCSPPLKACLLMSYDYLRLYTNAFAFQATVRRALPTNPTQNADSSSTSPLAMQNPQRVFSNNVGAVGDARFIFEGLDAAKAILTTANNFVDPEKTLRFLPLRFYLYLVYAGVFLYRARCTGVIAGDEDYAIRAMINETVSRLQRSSPSSGVNNIQHPGSRYAQLLKLLWAKIPRKDGKSRGRAQSWRHPGTNTANIPHQTHDSAGSTSSFSQPQSSTAQAQAHQTQTPMVLHSPLTDIGSASTAGTEAQAEPMGDFGWTDLGAVGEFAINGAGAGTGTEGGEAAFWNGFLPLDMGWAGGGVDLGLGWDASGGGGFANL